jgi:hypothetical protein
MASSLRVDDLLAVARTAEEVGRQLHNFTNYVEESSTDIMGVISELYSTSTALRTLCDVLRNPRFYAGRQQAEFDLRLGYESLSITLDDLRKMFVRLSITRQRSDASYRRVWREICSKFRDEDGGPLVVRLELYHMFFLEIAFRVEGSPPGPVDMKSLQRRLQGIFQFQESPLTVAIGGIVLDQGGETMISNACRDLIVLLPTHSSAFRCPCWAT